MLAVESIWGIYLLCLVQWFFSHLCPHVHNLFLNLKCSSELAQRVGINEIAESMMAFNTNYKDTGLFGVYAVAKVSLPLKHCVSLSLNPACCLFPVLNIHKPFFQFSFHIIICILNIWSFLLILFSLSCFFFSSWQ